MRQGVSEANSAARQLLAAHADYMAAETGITPQEYLDRIQVDERAGEASFEPALQRDETSFAAAVDQFIEGHKFNSPIRVMTTPLAMKIAGAKVLPVEVSPSVLQKVLVGKHAGNMTPEILKQVPRALADPVMIFDSETVPGRSVVLLSLKDTDGVNIVVPFELGAESIRGAYFMNVMTSVYGRGKNLQSGERVIDMGWLNRQIEAGRLRYINKKATINEFSQHALQLRPEKLVTTATGESIPDETDLVKLREVTPGFYQRTGGGTRGSVTLENGRRYVRLFSAADESTLAHEAGHIFLEDLVGMIKSGNASAQAQSDWGEVRAFLNMEDGQQVPTRAQHEQFADAFLRYLREGKSPTKQLAGIFRRFKEWLRRIFKHADELGVRLSPEIRRVFGRLLGGELPGREAFAIRDRQKAQESALPDILKMGKFINRKSNWKGRGYSTVTFAAPVMIDGQRGNVAAVVRKTREQNKYYGGMKISTLQN